MVPDAAYQRHAEDGGLSWKPSCFLLTNSRIGLKQCCMPIPDVALPTVCLFCQGIVDLKGPSQ